MSTQSVHVQGPARSLAIKLAECANRVRFKHDDKELAEMILELANEVWDLPAPSHHRETR
jgi:hypothetical protein